MATAARRRPKTLNFITGNKNKLAESQAILGDVNVDGVKLELQGKALDLVEIQGTSEEIARDKCARAAVLVSNESDLSSPLEGLEGPCWRTWFGGLRGKGSFFSDEVHGNAKGFCTAAAAAALEVLRGDLDGVGTDEVEDRG